MSKVFFDMAISLDGYVAGDNRGPKNPLGDSGTDLHLWMYKQKAFFKSLGMEGGELDDKDGDLIREVFARTGAYIMGKRMFEEGEVNWPEDLYKTDIFVLTHEKREPWVQKGTTTFYFENEGLETALKKAKQSANGKDVRIQGGAETVQQFLNAGLIDECTIHYSPKILGSGIRLFDNLDKNIYDMEIDKVIESNLTTHIVYKFTKNE